MSFAPKRGSSYFLHDEPVSDQITKARFYKNRSSAIEELFSSSFINFFKHPSLNFLVILELTTLGFDG